MSKAELFEKFLHEMNDYWRHCNQEYVPFAKSQVIRILNKLYDGKENENWAAQEILWYLVDAFPAEQECLKPMQTIAQEIAYQESEDNE